MEGFEYVGTRLTENDFHVYGVFLWSELRKMAQKTKRPTNCLWVVEKKPMRLLRYYGASIDPHIGVQMHNARRQAMCKVELDIPVKVQERFARRQAGRNLIG